MPIRDTASTYGAISVLSHAVVALEHQLVDHDATFVRMTGRGA